MYGVLRRAPFARELQVALWISLSRKREREQIATGMSE
jgi:hypothetical protein